MAGKISAAMVKELRDKTGAGPLDSKKALEANDGDMEKAVEWLREKGLGKAIKKLGKGRTMNEGLVEMYQHFDKSMAVIVEVNCETDFVSRNEKFQTFARDIALHISSMAPQYVNREEVPEDVINAVEEAQREAWYRDHVLLDQEFIKDDSKTIDQLVKEAVAELGESIQISRFARFVVGESGDDEEGDEE